MKSLYTATLLLLTISLTRFTSIIEYKITEFHNFGTYIGGGTIESSPIQLQLNDDFTFSYLDVTNSEEKVEIKGTWKQNGKKIQLLGNEDIKFHNQWKIDPNCTCLKSKKGLAFYRLCQ